MQTLPLIFPAIVGIAVLLWLSTRAVVDGAVVTVRPGMRHAAVVKYRYGRQVIRFAAQVGPPPLNQRALFRVEVPGRLYRTDGEAIPEAEVDLIVSRLSRGLSTLDIACEFYSPEGQSAGFLTSSR